MKTTSFKLVFAAMALVALQAGATNIGFEGVVSDIDVLSPATPYSESGYTLSDPLNLGANGISGKDASNTDGSAVFLLCPVETSCSGEPFPVPGSIITLTADDAVPFSLTSIDVGNYDTNPLPGTIDLIGHMTGGGVIALTVGTSPVWQTYAIAGFDNLVSVDFIAHTDLSQDVPLFALSIDNLVVAPTTVPEPASLALLGMGLLGLRTVRRRKNR